MWVVREFDMSYRSFGSVDHSFHSNGNWLHHTHYQVRVGLVNTQTGEFLNVRNTSLHESAFISMIEKFDPYGFGVSTLSKHVNGFEDEKTYYFVPVDALSLQMLDYVKVIKPVKAVSQSYTDKFFAWLNEELARYTVNGFVSVDTQNSLFKFHTNSARPDGGNPLCTLLDIMCMCPTWWYNDEFYIVVDVKRYISPSYYKVSFSDVQKARALAAKALTLGSSRFAGLVKKRW